MACLGIHTIKGHMCRHTWKELMPLAGKIERQQFHFTAKQKRKHNCSHSPVTVLVTYGMQKSQASVDTVMYYEQVLYRVGRTDNDCCGRRKSFCGEL